MKKHVLLIEDDVIVRENTAEILRFANYKVTTAIDGKMGVEKAIKLKPDIIVCDIMMPKLDGFGVCQMLSEKEYLINTPFIFLTAKTNHSDVRKGMNLGADDFITKPFEESELLSCIAVRLKKVNALKHDQQQPVDLRKNQPVKIVKDVKQLIEIFRKRDTCIYHKGDSLFCEGNKSNHIFLVNEGEIKTFKTTESGKEFITGFFGKDRFIGYTSSLGDFPHTENAEAIRDAKVIKIDKKEILSFMASNSNIALNLLELLAKNIKETREKLVQVAYDSVRGRTAKSLLVLVADDPLKEIVITRSDLASLTGIAKETLIRTLSDFKEEGYIETSRNIVKIIDEKALSRIQ